MPPKTRNRHVLTIDIEFDQPVKNAAQAAVRLAEDMLPELQGDSPWGWGRARVVGVYPNHEVMDRPVFEPEGL